MICIAPSDGASFGLRHLGREQVFYTKATPMATMTCESHENTTEMETWIARLNQHHTAHRKPHHDSGQHRVRYYPHQTRDSNGSNCVYETYGFAAGKI
eukprot:8238799-Pyramimonas_sp.AAC.1